MRPPTPPAATRGHWGIENTHYTRDVTMGEDASRIRSNSGVFARLRSFAYNILKANRIGTLAQDRYRAALGGLGRLLKLLDVDQPWSPALPAKSDPQRFRFNDVTPRKNRRLRRRLTAAAMQGGVFVAAALLLAYLLFAIVSVATPFVEVFIGRKS